MTVRFIKKLSETFKRLSETFSDFQRLSETFKRLSETFWEFQRLSETFRDIQRLFRDFQNSSWIRWSSMNKTSTSWKRWSIWTKVVTRTTRTRTTRTRTTIFKLVGPCEILSRSKTVTFGIMGKHATSSLFRSKELWWKSLSHNKTLNKKRPHPQAKKNRYCETLDSFLAQKFCKKKSEKKFSTKISIFAPKMRKRESLQLRRSLIF